MCKVRVASGEFGNDEIVPECAGELQRICADIERFAKTIEARRRPVPDEPRAAPETVEIGSERHLLLIARNRSRRAKFFKSDLFADPAWDMLLDLYRARLANQPVSVTSVCLASGVAMTTALRWLKTLEGEGLVVRSQDPGDCRRVFVELTDKAAASMRSYIKAAQDVLVA